MPENDYDGIAEPVDGGGGTVWTPTQTTTVIPVPPSITESSCVQIDLPELFGGSKKEGGIVGKMCVMMGEADQVPIADLTAMHAAAGSTVAVPGYRGVTTVFYDGEICTNNPYPKVWKHRVRRIYQGWEQEVPWPTTARIILAPYDVVEDDFETYDVIFAMNGAHIIFECATNKAWGRGLDNVFIDEDSFARAAITLKEECFGLCLKWSRQDDLGTFVQQVLDHIGAATYINRQNGKLTLKLIRNDYDVDELPVFTYDSGLLSIEEDTGTSSTGLVNEVVVWYKDPISNNKRSARVQNIAGMQSAGSVYSVTKQYPGIPTKTLALRVAQRDLLSQGTPIKRFTVKLDRRAWYLHPAAVIRVQDPYRGLNDIVLRVGKIVDGEDDAGSFVLTCLQDVFGLPATSFVGSESGAYTPPTYTPQLPVNYRGYEAPYVDLYRIAGATDAPLIDENSGFVQMLMKAPTTTTINFNLYTKTGSELYTFKSSVIPTAHATLAASVGGGAVLLTVSGFTEWSRLSFNTPVLVQNEIMRLNAWDSTASTITVSRGCADTTPAVHEAGASVWFPYTGKAPDPTEYADAEVVSMRPCPVTPSGALDVSLAPTFNVTLASRQTRPYPPANVKMNGVRFDAFTTPSAPAVNDLVITWSTRNRITQGDTLIPHIADSITPEVGQTVKLRIRSGGVVVRTEVFTIEDTFTYTEAMRTTDGVTTDCEVLLHSERDGYTSRHSYTIPFTFT